MTQPDFPTEKLAAVYREAAQGALPEITKTVARLTAKAFGEHTRLIVDYTRGDPWDHSGELVDTGMPFIVENYVTLGDFWGEREGGRTPTYESGYGWHFVTFGDVIRDEIPHWLTPHFRQALARLANDDPAYYGHIVAFIRAENGTDPQTPDEVLDGLRFTDLMGDDEIACEHDVLAHLEPLLLASLLRGKRLPRVCQRTVLEAIPRLAGFIDELAGYCETIAHVTALNETGPLQLHMERTDTGVVFGTYEGAREVLMDHIADGGSVVLRTTLSGADDDGHTLEGLRGWFITAEADGFTPHRILPDDLYTAMNTDAETGAKLPPEPHVRYL